MKSNPRSCLYRMLLAAGGLFGICLFLSVISLISKRNLPSENHADQLSELDKARLSESLQLKSALGDQVWTGWGDTDIPVIIWNDSYEFLFKYKEEPPTDWSLMANDDLNGEPYFRRKADNSQNFAVRVNDTWTASIATKDAADLFLINSYRGILPSPIKQVFPYRLLLQPSETQIGALLHETFHVFQYQVAPNRMDVAESIHRLGDQYETDSETFTSEWNSESALLADALEAETQEEKINLVDQFLSMRGSRRKGYKLSDELIEYERWLEWEEGTAKYIEVAILKEAGESTDYQPVAGMKNDTDFKQYQAFSQRWSQEMIQLRYPTTSGESNFYMTGMAQAFLLDSLLPYWKEQYWKEDIFLEDLLRLAITN